MMRSRTTIAFLMVLAAIALCLCYALVAPFLKPIIFAAVLVIICYPAYIRVGRWIRNRNIAAALTTTSVLLAIASTSIFLGRALVAALHDIYESLTGSGGGEERLGVFIVQLVNRAIAWLSHYVPVTVPNLQSTVSSQAENAISSLLTITAGLVGSLSVFGLNTFIAIVVLFFLFRDGRSMLRRLSVMLPLV